MTKLWCVKGKRKPKKKNHQWATAERTTDRAASWARGRPARSGGLTRGAEEIGGGRNPRAAQARLRRAPTPRPAGGAAGSDARGRAQTGAAATRPGSDVGAAARLPESRRQNPGPAAAMKKQFNRMKQLANQTVGRRVRRAGVSGVGRAGGRASSSLGPAAPPSRALPVLSPGVWAGRSLSSPEARPVGFLPETRFQPSEDAVGTALPYIARWPSVGTGSLTLVPLAEQASLRPLGNSGCCCLQTRANGHQSPAAPS